MNKRRMSLALSLSVITGQVLLAPANAADAIWQQASGSKAKKIEKKKAKPAARAAAKPVSRLDAAKIADKHVMLFLNNKKPSTADVAPAAALSVHPALKSLDTAKTTNISKLVQPKAGSDNASEQLISQLAPDQLIAQTTSSGVTATPIPPVVTGAVDLEEFKTTNVIDLKVSQSRTFKLRNKIVRTSIADPGIAEPVVVAENQMVMLGKAPGSTTMVLWDDAGNTAAVDIVVNRDYSELQTALREIDPRIIVKAFSVGGSDRVILLGDVDHPESVIRAFLASNVFMDDRGMNIQIANNRLMGARIGEIGAQGGTTGGGGSTGALATLSSVDRYTFFPNINNNVSKAQVIASDGGRVTSLIKIRKVPLIVLHVTFLEMNTATARQLATAVGFNGTTKGFAFGVGGVDPGSGGSSVLQPFGGINQLVPTNFAQAPGGITDPPVAAGAVTEGYSTSPVAFTSTSGISNAGPYNWIGVPSFIVPQQALTSSVLFGAPGGAGFSPNGLMNLFTASTNIPSGSKSRYSVQPTIQGIINLNRARLLAEPSLVCISGERSAFLAGGEIPILQAVAAAGQAQQSVVFEPFGLRINFIPVLMENGSVNLQVAPEERIPVIGQSFNIQIPGSGTKIPAFTTRKAQTIVEMKPGQELFIGGMITSNNGRQLTKLPIIGEVPVLGALYRSKAFSKNESELVVAVRPEIILPGTPGQLKLPEEIGRVEGPRDVNMFQVEPTVLDERHYSSGRSERHQKTSPTLPEGAPIPDSE